MKPSAGSPARSVAILLVTIVGVVVFGLRLVRPIPGSDASKATHRGAPHEVPASGTSAVSSPAVVYRIGGPRLAGRMDPGSIPGRVPSATEICIAHERALFGSEIDALRSREVSANPLVRAASASVRRLVEARLEVRIEAIAAVGPGSLPGRRPGVWAEAGLDGDPGAPLSDAVAMHPLWEASIERDGPRHEAFLRGASVEFRRIGLPKAWDAYLTLFLLEAVDEIDMLAAIAVTDGPRMGEFPPEVIGAGPPETSDPTLYAAWLHRQVTLGMLRRMGVPVDERFEHVFLNAGLGEGLTPYASR